MTDQTAGSGARSSAWCTQVPIGSLSGRAILFHIGDRSSIPPAVHENNVTVPTTTGLYFATRETAHIATYLAPGTITKLFSGLVATGVLLREKDPTFLVRAGIRSKLHNASPTYYLNDRIDAKAAHWLPLAFAVAMGHLSNKKTDRPVRYMQFDDSDSDSRKHHLVPRETIYLDHGPDLLTAMAALVPAGIFPPGYSSADAVNAVSPNGGGANKGADPNAESDDDDPDDDPPTPKRRTTRKATPASPATANRADPAGPAPVAAAPEQTAQSVTPQRRLGGWATAVAAPPTQPAIPTGPSVPATLVEVPGLDEVAEKREKTKRLKSEANKVLQDFREQSLVPISEERGKAWWAQLSKLICALLDEGHAADALVGALVQTREPNPKEHALRRILDGPGTGGRRMNVMDAVMRGGTSQPRGEYDAAEMDLANELGLTP